MAKQTTVASRKTVRSKMALAVGVSERVELLHVFMTDSQARRNGFRGSLPGRIEMRIDVQTEADKKQGTIRVRPHFTLDTRYEDEDEEVLHIEATFQLDYRLPSFAGLRKVNVEAFGELNGVFNVWPYWREFVQSTTVRMGLPPLTIPVHRLPGAPAPTTGGKTSAGGKKKSMTSTAR